VVSGGLTASSHEGGVGWRPLSDGSPIGIFVMVWKRCRVIFGDSLVAQVKSFGHSVLVYREELGIGFSCRLIALTQDLRNR
jgi:hypothetical protein